ncbi:TetR/AcrR family transcriptional regulator [Lentzea tibetensis]|uniref:TetR/AcrR family transcriptional regulator n=1 Tax=Lentzea tibetensis TaxID=2591470 RepID=A0A563EFW6_9PSEU|nr:TetR/AcrR family transcriptional regulator [Lentzea tibetensis]TWP44987.1 TetR/AcrR family transcriptional regulator [Lentzea tibetensis]
MNARPGGRTARVRAAVLEATYEELAEHGWSGLTIENVATRAGVHKTTVYRRWATTDGLIADALAATAADTWPMPDTGSLEGDLIELAREIVRGTSPVFEAVIAAGFQSARARDALRDFYTRRHEQAAVVVVRGIGRGEVPAGTSPEELVRLTCAPLFYRYFITREPVDDAVAVRSARAAFAAAAAGVLC